MSGGVEKTDGREASRRQKKKTGGRKRWGGEGSREKVDNGYVAENGSVNVREEKVEGYGEQGQG